MPNARDRVQSRRRGLPALASASMMYRTLTVKSWVRGESPAAHWGELRRGWWETRAGACNLGDDEVDVIDRRSLTRGEPGQLDA